MEGDHKSGDRRLQSEDVLASCMKSVSLNDEQCRTQSEVPQSTMQSGASGDIQCYQVLVSGIPLSVTEDHFLNYLECLEGIDCEVNHIDVGTKPGVAIVTFENSVDLTELQNAVNDSPLEGAVIQVSQLDTRGAVMIRNFSPDTTTNSFLFYLRNTKRHCGEKGVQAKRDPDNNYLIAYFSSMEVAKAVAGSHHKLEGHILDVVAFNPNLGPPQIKKGTDPMESTGGDVDAAESEILSGVENVSLSEKLESVREELDTPPREKTVDVEELHFAYRSVINVFSEMIQQMFLGICITVDNQTVKVQGDEANVELAEKLLHNLFMKQKDSEFLQSLPENFDGWDKIFEDMEEEVGRSEYIIQIREGLTQCGSLEDELCVSTRDAELSFDEFLQNYINKKEVVAVGNAEQHLLASTAWDEFIEGEFEEEFGRRMLAMKNEEGTRVTLFGAAWHLEKAADFVSQFLQNTPVSKTLPLSQTQTNFLLNFCKSELEHIQTGTGFDAASLHFSEDVCEVTGNQPGVYRAFNALEKICKQLMYSRAIYCCPGLGGFTLTEEWKQMLETVGKEHRCIISELPDLSVKDEEAGYEEWGPCEATILHSFCSNCSCHLVEGDVRAMKVDAIVCFQSSPMYPSGESGASQRDSGARPKAYQFNSREPASDSSSGITLTQPGALPCKAIILVDPRKYFLSNADVDGNSLMFMVKDILELAENHYFSSLAIPAIGVDACAGPGPLSFPIDVSTDAIVQSICHHFQFPPKFGTKYWKDSVSVGQPCEKTRILDICLCSRRAACIRGFKFAFEENTELTAWPPVPGCIRMLSCRQDTGDSSLKTGKRSVLIITGDIADERADVVIVPLDDDLDVNKNRVTRSLASKGGPSEYGLTHRSSWPWPFGKKTEPQDWEEKFVDERFLEGPSGTWNAHRIFYLYLPPWGPEVRKILTSLLQRCLQEADKKGNKSLAFSALGVGKLGYPAEFSARTMLSVISDYMEQNPRGVESIRIVIFPTQLETYNAFSREHSLWKFHKVADPPQVYKDPEVSYSRAASSNRRGGSGHRGRGGGSRSHGQGRGHASPTHTSHKNDTLHHGNPYSNIRTFQFKQVKITVKQGNIIHEKCDVIVNSTNSEFDLSRGSISRALLKHCGQKLQEECKKKRNKEKLKSRGCVLTSAPNLHDRKVLHVDLGMFLLKPIEMVKKCLEVVRDCSTLSSIAFPAFATGAKSCDSAPVVSALVKAIGEFKKLRQVDDIRLVISKADLFQHLSRTMEEMLASQEPQPKQQGGKSSEKSSEKYVGMRSLVYPPTAPTQSHNGGQAHLPPLVYPTSSHTSKRPPSRGSYSQSPASEAVSVYIFSDNREDRLAAKEELETWIFTQLGTHDREDGSHASSPPAEGRANYSRGHGRSQYSHYGRGSQYPHFQGHSAGVHYRK